VLIGTLYPLVVEALTGEKISVGAPFFNLTFGTLMVPLLIAVPFGPMLAWKRGDLAAASQRLYAAAGGALLVAVLTLLLVDSVTAFVAVGAALATWLVLGALTDLFLKGGFGKVSASVALRRLAGLPASAFGTSLAHLGLGLTTLGIVCVMGLQQERIVAMKPGDTVAIAGYVLSFKDIVPVRGPNYSEDQAHFDLATDGGKALGTIVSAKRMYTARQMPTTEAGISTRGLSQIYVSLGDPASNGGVVVRVWWKPLVTLIWLGAVVMMLGGALSLSDRRLRVGAPATKKQRIATAGQG
jgi:cytochrome c-type biogenesis protein CcmF